MKNVAYYLYFKAMIQLDSMKKTGMDLSDRIKYEKAIENLKALKDVLDKM